MEESEIFKDLVLKGFEIFNGFYKIGNYGTLISNSRAYTRLYRNGTVTTNTTKESIHKPRCSQKCPLLFSELYAIITDEKGEKIKVLKTVYIHRLVAEHFVEKPKDRGKDKVTHIDHTQPQNNYYKNVMWTDQPFLSKRSMITHPHNRDNLKRANIKSGYYDSLRKK